MIFPRLQLPRKPTRFQWIHHIRATTKQRKILTHTEGRSPLKSWGVYGLPEAPSLTLAHDIYEPSRTGERLASHDYHGPEHMSYRYAMGARHRVFTRQKACRNPNCGAADREEQRPAVDVFDETNLYKSDRIANADGVGDRFFSRSGLLESAGLQCEKLKVVQRAVRIWQCSGDGSIGTPTPRSGLRYPT